MDFVKAIIGFAVIIGIALFLGRLDHNKHPESYVYGWIGSIVVLLLVGWNL